MHTWVLSGSVLHVIFNTLWSNCQFCNLWYLRYLHVFVQWLKMLLPVAKFFFLVFLGSTAPASPDESNKEVCARHGKTNCSRFLFNLCIYLGFLLDPYIIKWIINTKMVGIIFCVFVWPEMGVFMNYFDLLLTDLQLLLDILAKK